jgi:hypothetical protein
MALAQDFCGLLQSAVSTSIYILDLVSILCAHIETLLLWIFGIPAPAPFRMFIAYLEHPFFSQGEAKISRLIALACLLLIPRMVHEQRRRPLQYKSPLIRLMYPFTENSKRAVYALMLVGTWVGVAVCNALTLHLINVGGPFFPASTMAFSFCCLMALG